MSASFSTSSGSKQDLYSKPSRSGQEIKVLTSFGNSAKNPEGGDGANFWLELENPYGFTACVLECYELARPAYRSCQYILYD